MNKSIVISIVVILLGLTVASSYAGVYYYRQYRLMVTDSQKVVEVQEQIILKKIASVMDLPSEKPSIVTVTDREKLQGQEFFKKSQNGDKIIMYEAAKRVILYRPSTGRVIDVAPLVFNTQNNSVFTAESTIPTPTLIINKESSLSGSINLKPTNYSSPSSIFIP